MNRRAIALGVVAAAALTYAGIVVLAIAIGLRGTPDERATLVVASVLVLLVGVFVAVFVGLTFIPAYFIAQRLGGGALPYLAWGAMTFGSIGLPARDALSTEAGSTVLLTFAATGALVGAAFWLGARRGLAANRSGWP